MYCVVLLCSLFCSGRLYISLHFLRIFFLLLFLKLGFYLSVVFFCFCIFRFMFFYFMFWIRRHLKRLHNIRIIICINACKICVELVCRTLQKCKKSLVTEFFFDSVGCNLTKNGLHQRFQRFFPVTFVKFFWRYSF